MGERHQLGGRGDAIKGKTEKKAFRRGCWGDSFAISGTRSKSEGKGEKKNHTQRAKTEKRRKVGTAPLAKGDR